MKIRSFALLLTFSLLPAARLTAAPGDGPSLNINSSSTYFNSLGAASGTGVFGSDNLLSGITDSVVVGFGNGDGEFGASYSIIAGTSNFTETGPVFVAQSSVIIGAYNDYAQEAGQSSSSDCNVNSLVVGMGNSTSVGSSLVAGVNNYAIGQAFLLGNGLISEYTNGLVAVGESNAATPPAGKTFRFVVGNGTFLGPTPTRRNAFEIYTDNEAAFRGPVKFFNGAALTPSLELDPVAAQIRVNGQALLVPNASGYVGLGTSSPTARLTFATGTTAAAGIAFGDINLYRGLSSGITSLMTTAQNVIVPYGGGFGIDNNNKIQFGPVGNVNIQRNGSSALFVDGATGNVGLGTTSPTAGARLDVVGGAIRGQAAAVPGTAVGLALYHGDGGQTNRLDLQMYPRSTAPITWSGLRAYGEAGPKAGLIFLTSSWNVAPTERMRITADGNVGIGTNADPVVKFEVNGTTRILGATLLTNTLAVSGAATLTNTVQMSGAVTMSSTVTMPRQGDVGMGQFGNGGSDL